MLSVKLKFGSLWLLLTHTSLVGYVRKCLYKLCFVTEWSSLCERHRCHNVSVTVTAALLLLLRMTLLLPFYTPYTSPLAQIPTSKQLRITHIMTSSLWSHDFCVYLAFGTQMLWKNETWWEESNVNHNMIEEKHMGFETISKNICCIDYNLY